jgi:Tfp pilus assembly protein PilF
VAQHYPVGGKVLFLSISFKTRRAAAQVLVALAALRVSAQVDTRLEEAIRIHQSGDAGAAIPLYRAFLKAHPDSVDGLVNYGAALAHEGLFGEAISQYESALKIQPGNPQVVLNLALSFYKTGRYSDARERFQSMLPIVAQFSPPHRQVSFLLADCDLRLGDYKATIELLDPWEKQAPDDMALAYLLGTRVDPRPPDRARVGRNRQDPAEGRFGRGTLTAGYGKVEFNGFYRCAGGTRESRGTESPLAGSARISRACAAGPQPG